MAQILPLTPIHSTSRPFRHPSFEFPNKYEYMKKKKNVHESENSNLPGCDEVSSGECFSTFRRNVSPSFLGATMTKAFETSATTHPTMQRHMPDNRNAELQRIHASVY